ncbi:hypothetical protein, conserved [Babesia ovata]|uniref:C3H1-type domain-containing protein n=1 Tax=Babesia ovata TaxID=189622 RepID=A0A2H6KIX1_9APIC|nr:uncharacterized protein BOVATA_044300 [Babesia ovata]GBE62937.1 hypothetical protein, conserved [Babesia ovata]
MAFLHGVLESVKGDESVTTYNEYIDSPKINNVIDTLSTSVGKGREAFQAAVRQVEERTGRVTRHLEALKHNITTDKSNIDRESINDLTYLVSEWSKRAKVYVTMAQQADEAREELDPQLSGKLDKHVSLVVQVTETFKMEAENGDLDTMFKLAGEKMGEVTGQVARIAEEKSRSLRRYLKHHIGKLRTKLHELRIGKFKGLQDSVDKDLQYAFNTVSGALANLNDRYTSDVSSPLERILAEASAVLEGVQRDKNALKDQVSSLNTRMSGLLAAAADVKSKVPTEFSAFNNIMGDWTVSTQIWPLTQAIKMNVGNYLESLKSDLAQAVSVAIESNPVGGNYPGLKALQGTDLWKVQEVSRWIDGPMRDPSPTGPGAKLERVLNNLHGAKREWSSIRSNISFNIFNGIKEEFGKKATNAEVEEKLFNLLKATADEAINKLQAAVTKIVGDQRNTKDTLDGIKKALTALQSKEESGVTTAADGGQSPLEKKAFDLHKMIESFLTDKVGKNIDDHHPKEGTVYKDLLKLKKDVNDLGEKVKEIKNKITPVSEDLEMCILDANAVLTNAPMETNKIINQLRDEVNSYIGSEFREMKAKAKSLYTARKTQEVTALQKIVEKEFNDIKIIINNDKILGLKNLLTNLKKKFVDTLHPFAQTLSTSQAPAEQKKLADLAQKVSACFQTFLAEMQQQGDIILLRPYLHQLSNAINTLLNPLTHYNHRFSVDLESLKTALADIHMSLYYGNTKMISTVLKHALNEFAAELDKAYISRYTEETFAEKLVKNFKTVVTPQNSYDTYDVTEQGTKLSYVCLTIFQIIHRHLSTLLDGCDNEWRALKTNLTGHNSLATFFESCGYEVSDSTTVHNGELRNNMKGEEILTKLKTENIFGSNLLKGPAIDVSYYLKLYCRVCHISTFSSKKHPCSVFDMLCWLNGLQFNRAYSVVRDHIKTMFPKPKNYEDREYIDIPPKDLTFHAYPDVFTAANMQATIRDISRQAHDVLTTIVGTGDASTMYACEYSNNTLNFSYPSDSATCFDMLISIFRKILPTLRFLEQMCHLKTEYYGWSRCAYGNGVQTSCSQCGQHSTVHPSPSHECSVTSPLHLYLTDGLRGMLPHELTNVGCKSVCSSCPKSAPGMPCLTPLGFTSFSGSKRTGSDLCKVLTKFLSNDYVKCLFTLSPKAPSTLPEHLSYLINHFGGWQQNPPTSKNGLQLAFEKSMKKLSIDQVSDANKLGTTLRNMYGFKNTKNGVTIPHPDDNHTDLISVCLPQNMTSCAGRDYRCAPYLSSLTNDSYYCMATKHADLYLSWAIYLPWNLWDLLKRLLDAFQSIDCKSFGCSAYSTKPGKHGVDFNCKCKALTRCRGVLPTFYQYGFTFGNPQMLLDGATRKFCTDFCTQMRNVLHSKYFQILFEECDNFLCTIRWPFMLTLLALWSLSLLYLLHIAVVRLDVLRIRSHLRSPSSHRIAAQSLLAAVRVKALANVKYFSP